jgi:hypothetical protein
MKLKHYVIASEHNDWQPWIIRPTAFVCFCIMTWTLRLALPVSFSFAQATIDAADVMAKINLERTNRFIPALTSNSKLSTAAGAKSNDMLARSYFAHVDPDGNYVWGRIESAGYAPYLTLGENLAMDFGSASGVVEAWMNSPTHRANIVNQKFEDQGLASIYGLFEPDHYTIMITSLFGTLLNQNPTPQPPPPPPPQTAKPLPPPPASKPAPAPNPPPPPQAPPQNPITINPDVNISKKIIGDDQILEIDVVISGSPERVIAMLKDKTIDLLPSAITGQYLGVFSFPAGNDLGEEKIFVEATSKNKEPARAEFSLANVYDRTLPDSNPTGSIPVSQEVQFIKVLKIIFAILASLYVIFLVVDSLIIRRAKIKRSNIHSSRSALLFLLIALVNMLGIWP